MGSLRDATWNYWAWGLATDEYKHRVTRECELLERLALPLIGHLKVEDIEAEHVKALRFVLAAQGLGPALVKEV